MLSSSFTITSLPTHTNEIRIDVALATQYPSHSRSFFSRLINEGLILINHTPCKKAGTAVRIGDMITMHMPEKKVIEPQNPQFDCGVKLLFEHEHFLIVDKPAGLLTHEAHQYDTTGSLVDWLLIHYPALATVGYHARPGIVHRLDKDTSGILIIPKTTEAHVYFAHAFKNRAITKEYIALVSGAPERHAIIDFEIGRDPYQKTKMKAFKTSQKNHIKTREAITEFITQNYYQNAALLLVKPKTGRTHQIRVHLAAHGNPIIGDPVYGVKSPLISRHALHAHALSFAFHNQQFRFESSLPDDMQLLIQALLPIPSTLITT